MPTPPTQAQTRTAVVTALGVSADILAERGATRNARTDLARATLMHLYTEDLGLSVLEASRALGFRSKEAGAKLLADFDAGEWDESELLPSGITTTAALATAARAEYPEPFP